MKKKLSFPEVTLRFLSHLSKNNNKEWFEANRVRYNLEFLEPATRFVLDLGEKLTQISPDLHYIPKIDKSIFRLHRDVRFSKDKSPYKTNLGILLWEGSGKKLECSGYYFHLEPGNFFLGTGMYVFSDEQLKKYRNLVADNQTAKELFGIIRNILKNKDFKLGGKTFKRVPKGFDPEYKYVDLMLHNGIYTYYETNNPSDLKDKNLVDFCFGKFKKQHQLHQWLVDNMI
jgi:uncharacterized protein (TIGR02453 family)